MRVNVTRPFPALAPKMQSRNREAVGEHFLGRATVGILYKRVVFGLYYAAPRLTPFSLILTSSHRTILNFVSQQSFKPNSINKTPSRWLLIQELLRKYSVTSPTFFLPRHRMIGNHLLPLNCSWLWPRYKFQASFMYWKLHGTINSYQVMHLQAWDE